MYIKYYFLETINLNTFNLFSLHSTMLDNSFAYQDPSSYLSVIMDHKYIQCILI